MTKLRGALCAAALAIVMIVAGAGSAFAAVPVAPSNTPASAFASAESCNCHSTFIQEWKQSMHAQALKDPVYKVKLAEAKAAGGAPLAAWCLKCHGPVGTMTGLLGNLTDPNSAAAEGIPCSFCHQVVGAGNPTNNVSLLLDPSGTYRAQLTTATPPHKWAPSAFHNTAEICGSCHNVAHPANGLPVEATYTEWQASPQAKAGITCQDCHMSATPGQIGPSIGWAAGGGPRRPVFQMNFMGANVAQGNPVLAEQMLQNAATIEMVAPEVLNGATSTSVTVNITNVNAGHNLPTGLTEVRDMWLEVTFADFDGKTTTVGKHVYGTVLKDAAGKYPAQLWTATGIQSDDRIPPKGTSTNAFKFTFPAGTDAGSIKAQLLYRSVPDALAKSAKVENPVTVMAEAKQNIYVSSEAERAANNVYLEDASQSPLMPLVFAVLGMLLCFGLIIFFVWWGRRPVTPRGPSAGKAKAAKETDSDDASSDDTAVMEPVAETPAVDDKADHKVDLSAPADEPAKDDSAE
jgi:nitrate/TMAO reductase-like tetraheme cytochrome c subunit